MDINKYHSDRFSRMRDAFIRSGLFYTIETIGSTKKIIYNGRESVFPFIFKTEGKHIISKVRKDIEKNFMPNNPDFDYGIEQNWRIIDFNLPVLEQNIGRVITGIDISDCYWFTAYNLGIITKKMFIDGLIRDEWKAGRNMAIGALSTKIIKQNFEGDAVINSTSTEVFAGGTGLNNWIENTVWGVVNDIIGILGDEYLMFYVDCIWIKDDKVKTAQIVKALKDRGYNSKSSIYEVKFIDKDKVGLISIKDEPAYNRWLSGDKDPDKMPRLPLRQYYHGSGTKKD